MSPYGISLADDSFCIAATMVKFLEERCYCVTATKVGQGIRVARKFAVVKINGVLHFACTLTGTLFDEHGEHHTEVNLWLEDVPHVAMKHAREVRT